MWKCVLQLPGCKQHAAVLTSLNQSYWLQVHMPRPTYSNLCIRQGDYHRYLAEFKTGADRKEAAEHTLLAYKAAQVCGFGISMCHSAEPRCLFAALVKQVAVCRHSIWVCTCPAWLRLQWVWPLAPQRLHTLHGHAQTVFVMSSESSCAS